MRRRLPFKLPVNEYSHLRATLPQWYSDQFGWKEIADEAAVAWNRIPIEERSDCAIFAQDYGQAGAIDFFGPRSRPARRASAVTVRIGSGDRAATPAIA